MELKGFAQLEKKVNNLIEKYKEVKIENKKLSKEINELKNAIKTLKNLKEKATGKVKSMMTDVENLDLFT